VAFDLGGATFVTLHQCWLDKAAKRSCRCVVERFSRDYFFRLTRVGQRLLDGPAAGGKAGHGHRSTHDLEELSPRCPAGRSLGSRHELLCLKGAMLRIIELIGSTPPEPLSGCLLTLVVVVYDKKLNHYRTVECLRSMAACSSHPSVSSAHSAFKINVFKFLQPVTSNRQ